MPRKPGDESVDGTAVHLEGRAGLLNDALVHDDDAIAHRHGLFLVVRDVDGGGLETELEGLEFGAGGDAEARVEVRERFVEEKCLGLTDNGATDGDALALAAGELAGLALQERFDPEHRGGSADAALDVGLGNLPQHQREGHVLVDAHVRVERVVLEDHRDVAVLGMHVVDDAAGDGDGAAGDVLEAGDHAECGGLAAAGGADEDDELAVGDIEGDAFDRGEAVGVGFGQIGEGDIGHAGESVAARR